MTAPEIRAATPRDIEAFYGVRPGMTVKAYVAELDGRILGVGGMAFHGKQLVLFSDLKPEMKEFRFTIGRAVKKIMKLVQGKPVLAIADPDEPTACGLLTRLGFAQVAGPVYRRG